tara:strand:- start:2462 stop:3919 length:1458 start_codon:yes stop_codon:yes gene_type:complete
VNKDKEKFQIRNWELVSINPNNKNWGWFDFFNFWAISFQSLISFSLITSLYFLYDLNSIIVFSGCLFAAILVYFFSNLIGKISQTSGLSFPVILRLSMGFNGARYIGMTRGLVGLFMFGIQTFFISKSFGYLIRIFIHKIDSQLLQNENFLIFFFGLNLIDWASIITSLLFQFYLFSKTAEVNRKFIKFSAIFVYIGLIIFLIVIVSEHLNDLINSLKLSIVTQDPISKKNIFPFISITGTMFAYFSIIILNYGDFARYGKNFKEMKIGNLSIVLNLIIFTILSVLIVLGSDIILTKNAISLERLFTNPSDIIGKFDNNFLTVVSLFFIIIASLSTNLIANYIPSQNSLINFLPNLLNIKKTGILIFIVGFLIAMFWLSIFSKNIVMISFDTLAAFFGPIFGVVISDYYLVKKEKINHKELFYPNENTEYIYLKGWNYKGIYSIIIGFVFSAATIWNVSLIPFQPFGWIIGAFFSFLTYYLLNND